MAMAGAPAEPPSGSNITIEHVSTGQATLVRLSPNDAPYKIYCLIPHPHPEVVAMMQSLYSRSPMSIRQRIEVIDPSKASAFLEDYYAEYGHKSIADCGWILLCFEGIPDTVANQLQRDPRYCGQRASTRYMDLGGTPPYSPVGVKGATRIQRRWMKFYKKYLPAVQDYLRSQHPPPVPTGNADADKKARDEHTRAINARAFDIMRGFLPGGTPSNVSWMGSMRAIQDDLTQLSRHPDKRTAEIATVTLEGLQALIPGTFALPDPIGNPERYARHQARLAWWKKAQATSGQWSLRKNWLQGCDIRRITQVEVTIDKELDFSDEQIQLLAERPPFAELPYDFDLAGFIRGKGLLDYGSLRDLLRHRAFVMPIPLLTLAFGFSEWYLRQLPPQVAKKARALIREQIKAIGALPTKDPWKLQMCIPFGFLVPVHLLGPLRAWLYVLELRGKGDVHSTLRRLIHDFDKKLRREVTRVNPDLGTTYKVSVDYGPDNWQKRGKATIFNGKTGVAIGD